LVQSAGRRAAAPDAETSAVDAALRAMQSALRSSHLTLRSLHLTFWSLHLTLRSLHITLQSLHITLRSLHITLQSPKTPVIRTAEAGRVTVSGDDRGGAIQSERRGWRRKTRYPSRATIVRVPSGLTARGS
jgi:hypothetical protein